MIQQQFQQQMNKETPGGFLLKYFSFIFDERNEDRSLYKLDCESVERYTFCQVVFTQISI